MSAVAELEGLVFKGVSEATQNFTKFGIAVAALFITSVKPANNHLKNALESTEREKMLAQADTAVAERRIENAKNDRELKDYEAESRREHQKYEAETRRTNDAYVAETKRTNEEFAAETTRKNREYEAETSRTVETFEAKTQRDLDIERSETNRMLELDKAKTDLEVETERAKLVTVRNANVVSEAEANETAKRMELAPLKEFEASQLFALGIKELATDGRIGTMNITPELAASFKSAVAPNGS